ncbi:hypothetical protein [Patiriisocius marinus]|nr:hypothetical protein [Patiriisocius marinus]
MAIRLCILSVLMFVISSCSLNDDNSIVINDALLVKSISTNGVLTESFVYDDNDHLITRLGSYELGATRIEFEYEENLITYNYYNDQNELVRSLENHLEGGVFTRLDEIDVNTGDVFAYRLYATNSSTCNLDSVTYFDENQEQYLNIEFDYSDQNCSAEILLIDSNPDNRSRNITVNDGKNSAIKSLGYAFYDTVFAHNRLSYTNYNDANEVIPEISYSNEFTYNELDYPITETRTYGDERIVVYSYDYY